MSAIRVNSHIQKSISFLETSAKVTLSNLHDNEGARKVARRVGRGDGSGRGNKCGRGDKGQGQRNKLRIRLGFEGGTNPFYKKMPKHGFKPKNKKEYQRMTLSTLQYFLDRRRLNPEQPITLAELYTAGILSQSSHGILLTGEGKDVFKTKVNIEATRATPAAIDAIEQLGGTIKCVYHNRLALRTVYAPEAFVGGSMPRPALPPNGKLLRYYLNPAKRGYLLDKDKEGLLKLHDWYRPTPGLPEHLRSLPKPDPFPIYDITKKTYHKRLAEKAEKERLAWKGDDRWASKLLLPDAMEEKGKKTVLETAV